VSERAADLIARSLGAVWHPCTQMKHHEQFPLVAIERGEGVWLVDPDGKRYLDGVSSWWVNLFGHANPRINAALKDQLDRLPHVILAGFTQEPVVDLSERLAELSGLGHAFYGSDGASAVEIALKMSFHYWKNTGKPGKQKFVSLAGSYHGETLGALAVTDVALFRDAYGPLLRENIIAPLPGPGRSALSCESCCADCVQPALIALERIFATQHEAIAALIVEPLVQGAAGMRMYHPAYLTGARELCDQYGIHFIADEIMTGFGRTGTMFAHQQANIRPDFLCLSKGITAGYLPLSCVLTTDTVYAAFYDDATALGFLHSHSYTGNALACRAAVETLRIFADDEVIATNHVKANRFDALLAPLAAHANIRNIRRTGMIWAFDVDTSHADFSCLAFRLALDRGVLLRPIGNTVYFMPPYIIEDAEFRQLVDCGLDIAAQLGTGS
jgi:adenosylmethionine---8-amino-7-oxononanoate aminotransferase